jgi:hypothetical protein
MYFTFSYAKISEKKTLFWVFKKKLKMQKKKYFCLEKASNSCKALPLPHKEQ